MKKIVVWVLILITVLAVLSLLKNKKWSVVLDNPIAQLAFKAAGITPLHSAVIKGDSETLLKLINDGADVNKTSSDGTSPLHSACAFGYIKCVEILLSNGANIEARDARGDTPLGVAAFAGQLEVVKLLLESGARTDIKNAKGNTPLQIVLMANEGLSSNSIVSKVSSSQRHKLEQCAELLREHGAK